MAFHQKGRSYTKSSNDLPGLFYSIFLWIMPSARDHVPAADTKDKCEIFHFSKDMLNDKYQLIRYREKKKTACKGSGVDTLNKSI